MTQYIFLALAALSVITALLMVFSKNPVHSVLYLILTFFVIAGQYVLLNAQFLAVVHIIVYAGAIMVLFLFVLMLLNLNADTEPQKSSMWKLSAGIAAGLLLVTLVGALRGSVQIMVPQLENPQVGLVENLGKVLFTDFVVPFEIAGILFLAAMVGAVLVGKRDLKV
jgi:NADH-quinone oxidoreductase subunit J